MNADVRKDELRSELLHLRASAFICGSILLLLSGCSSAVSQGQNTALSGVDLVQMTDDMAMKIASDPAVREAIARDGPLKVVVLPAENRMRAEVLPSGQAEAFTGRVRTLLSHQLPSDFVWVMNRETFYRLRQKEIEGVEPGPAPEAVSPNYALSAVFTSLAEEDKKHRSSYYVCRFEITNLRDRTVLWSGAYDVKKIAVKGFLD